ncbi:UNVERIFIED_CONTAM: hypothetical protein HDU68_005974 [Siphonaria sp. JEL0065]|nr:hypothetical protein HDU68_005974 [Siphonaria sp. JEL0065]
MSDLDTSGKESDFQPSIPNDHQRTQRRMSARERFIRYKASKGIDVTTGSGGGDLDSVDSLEFGELQIGGGDRFGSLGRQPRLPSSIGVGDDWGASVLNSVNDATVTTASPGPPRRSSLLFQQDQHNPLIQTMGTRRLNTSNKGSINDFSSLGFIGDQVSSTPTPIHATFNHGLLSPTTPVAAGGTVGGAGENAFPFPVAAESLARPSRKERTVSLAVGAQQRQQILQQQEEAVRLSGGEFMPPHAGTTLDPASAGAGGRPATNSVYAESIASGQGSFTFEQQQQQQRQQFFSQQPQGQGQPEYDYQQGFQFPAPQQGFTFPPQQPGYAESTFSDDSANGQSIRSDDQGSNHQQQQQQHVFTGVGEAPVPIRFGPPLKMNFLRKTGGGGSGSGNAASVLEGGQMAGFMAGVALPGVGGGNSGEKKKKKNKEEVVDVSFGPPVKLNYQRRKSEGPSNMAGKSSMDSSKSSMDKRSGGDSTDDGRSILSKLARTLSKKKRGDSPSSVDGPGGEQQRSSAESLNELPEFKPIVLRPTEGVHSVRIPPPSFTPTPSTVGGSSSIVGSDDGANVHPSMGVASQIAFEEAAPSGASLRRAMSFSGTAASARSDDEGVEDRESRLAKFRAKKAAEKARLLAVKQGEF